MWITDFNVTLVDASGIRRTIARDGDVPKVEVADPLAWHIQHLKQLTDKDMHDVTAYLVTLK
jgi:cytochrome c oxidase cbb3-type subunit 3